MDLSDKALRERLESDLEHSRRSLGGVNIYSSMYTKWMVCAEKASLESIITDCITHKIQVPVWAETRLRKIEASYDWLS
jgi:hypothetical protein